MNERVDRIPKKNVTPVFPGGFALGEILHPGEQFSSVDSLVSNFWGRTTNLVISLDYHDTLTAPGQKVIPRPQLKALQRQARRLNILLGNNVDLLINTIGPFRNVETDTGFPVIANSGLDLRASPTSPIVQLYPDREQSFTQIRDRAASRLAAHSGPVVLINRNERASFIPFATEATTPETARTFLNSVITEDEASQLRIYVNTKDGKISISPGSFKHDGAVAFIVRNGKDPADTTYIHIGDESSDISLEGSPFGRNYFVTPFNAQSQVKEYASYQAGSSAPDAVPSVLREVADSVGRRVLTETMTALSADVTSGDRITAVGIVRNWFSTSIRILTDAFHTLPTQNLIFENLQNLLGTQLSLEQRRVMLNAAFDTSADMLGQFANFASVDMAEFKGHFDTHSFDDHPFTGQAETYPGMIFLARRGRDAREPVLTDAISASAEYETHALEVSARLTQELGGQIIEAFGENIRDVVFMSIYRGGIYPSIGLQQFIKTRTGTEIPHYSVIPHKLNEAKEINVDGEQKRIQYALAGEDLAYVLDQHPNAILLFVDGWVGSGQTISNLRDGLTARQNAGAMENDFYFASLVDAVGFTDFNATTQDQMLGWNLWQYNDYTYGFSHKNNQPGNTGLLYVSPDTNSFPITEMRLHQWLATVQNVSGQHEPRNGSERLTPSLSADEYIRRSQQVTGYSGEEFDMARIKLGINETFIRIRNDNGNFWKFLLVHSDFLHTPEMQKVLEVARNRGVRVFHSAEMPCLALVSQDPFSNPDVLSNELDITRSGHESDGTEGTVYIAE